MENTSNVRARITFLNHRVAFYFSQAREVVRALFDSAPFNGHLVLDLDFVDGRLCESKSKTIWTDDAARVAAEAEAVNNAR